MAACHWQRMTIQGHLDERRATQDQVWETWDARACSGRVTPNEDGCRTVGKLTPRYTTAPSFAGTNELAARLGARGGLLDLDQRIVLFEGLPHLDVDGL